MALPIPKLDDRSFQQLVDEAKKRIPHYTPEWTDHNVSDPGVTLIELFAWMMETALYRMNQVPDVHAIRFLEMLGLKLQEPQPARAPITFWFSAPQENEVVIPISTEVASTQTETERSTIFTTDADLTVRVPSLGVVMTRKAARQEGTKRYTAQNLKSLEAGFEGIDIFTETPQVDDALYFGFHNDVSRHVLGFDLRFDSAGGAGVNPDMPPYVWEASTGEAGDRWEACEVEEDTTRALNSAGRVMLHTPQMGLYKVDKDRLYWVRVRVRRLDSADQERGIRPYSKSPRMGRVRVAAWGGTVPASHAELAVREFLGRSNGDPGQRFRLARTPILQRKPDEHLIVHGDAEQAWHEVSDFADSGFHDPIYTLDSSTGELRLGPAVRQPDGTIKVYGKIPPRGANLWFTHYRTGGGTVGNVKANILNTLKTAIPYVAKVANRQGATGGLDAESLEAAMVRAPKLLRSQERAVSESDFEFLATQALPAQISRVKCLQPRPLDRQQVAPGRVFVLVIPRIERAMRLLSAAELTPDPAAIEQLTQYLDERRLLTVRLSVREPAYRAVAVRVELRATTGANQDGVEAAILARLHTFLNPLTGGVDGTGWPFGRDVYISDIYQALQGVEDILFLRKVEMYASEVAGERTGNAVEFLEVVAHGVVASGVHEVTFV
jgi:predicted phage baseplate assembly protein